MEAQTLRFKTEKLDTILFRSNTELCFLFHWFSIQICRLILSMWPKIQTMWPDQVLIRLYLDLNPNHQTVWFVKFIVLLEQTWLIMQLDLELRYKRVRLCIKLVLLQRMIWNMMMLLAILQTGLHFSSVKMLNWQIHQVLLNSRQQLF